MRQCNTYCRILHVHYISVSICNLKGNEKTNKKNQKNQQQQKTWENKKNRNTKKFIEYTRSVIFVVYIKTWFKSKLEQIYISSEKRRLFFIQSYVYFHVSVIKTMQTKIYIRSIESNDYSLIFFLYFRFTSCTNTQHIRDEIIIEKPTVQSTEKTELLQ